MSCCPMFTILNISFHNMLRVHGAADICMNTDITAIAPEVSFLPFSSLKSHQRQLPFAYLSLYKAPRRLHGHQWLRQPLLKLITDANTEVSFFPRIFLILPNIYTLLLSVCHDLSALFEALMHFSTTSPMNILTVCSNPLRSLEVCGQGSLSNISNFTIRFRSNLIIKSRYILHAQMP